VIISRSHFKPVVGRVGSGEVQKVWEEEGVIERGTSASRKEQILGERHTLLGESLLPTRRGTKKGGLLA